MITYRTLHLETEGGQVAGLFKADVLVAGHVTQPAAVRTFRRCDSSLLEVDAAGVGTHQPDGVKSSVVTSVLVVFNLAREYALHVSTLFKLFFTIIHYASLILHLITLHVRFGLATNIVF